MDDARYFITFIDDFLRKVWLYVLESKGNGFEKFKEFNESVETQSEHKIKTFRSDNGKKFVSKPFNQFLKDHGVEKQTSTPYTPHHIGVAERMNRTIVEMIRSVLHAQYLNKSIWVEAMVNAVYTQNRCLTKALGFIMPEETWNKKRPCTAHIRVFSILCFII
jgi:transposase InsO family protein